MLAIVLFTSSLETVEHNDGAGWDGLFYREIAYNFTDMAKNKEIDNYRIKRILPFAVINLFYSAFKIEKTNASLLLGMQVLNCITLCFGVYLFFLISRKMKLSASTEIVGFSAFFLNFPILKSMAYEPFQTDIYAFVLAMAMFCCFREQKRALLLFISFLGALTWPFMFLCGLILAFFPKKEFLMSSEASASLSKLKILSCFAIPVLYVSLLYFCSVKDKDIQFYYDKTIIWGFVIAALLTAPVYTYFLLKPIKFSFKAVLKDFIAAAKPINILCLLFIYLGFNMILRFLSNDIEMSSVPFMFIRHIIVASAQAPFAALVCHFMYFGLIVIFLCLYWKESVEKYAKYGYSFCIVIAIAFIMSFDVESRHLTALFPFMVFPLLEILNEKFNMRYAIVFLLISLVISRFYFPINVDGIAEAFANLYENHTSYENFPAQRYFMSFGPWMSYKMYAVFSGTFLLAYLIIYRIKISNLNSRWQKAS